MLFTNVSGNRFLRSKAVIVSTKAIRLIVVLLVTLCMHHKAVADQPVRLGTGGSDGTYFPIGSLIAAEINRRQLKLDGDVPLIVVPQRSNGSVANINDLSLKLLEIGLAQADVINLEYYSGDCAATCRKDSIAAIGTLYQESLHIVVRADSDINSITDLIGKRVSVDELGSGTHFNAEVILAASGLSLDQIKSIYLKPNDSIERMRRGLLDAIFVVAGYPVAGVRQLVDDNVGRIVALSDELVDQLTEEHLYFSAHSIPANIYSNEKPIDTLSVSAQMIARSDLDEEIVYEITSSLWSSRTLTALASGHLRGVDISAEKALQGIGIPLHRGALRYYNEHNYDTHDVPQ